MKLETLDKDVQSIQEARVLARQGKIAAQQFANYTEEQVDRILRNMVKKPLTMPLSWPRWQWKRLVSAR